jgi:hypothetical protein
MKSRVLISLLLTGILIPALATAQNQPATAGNEGTDPLYFVKIAADIARNVQQGSLEGYLAIYMSEQNWAEGLKDSDLGPFLKIKEAKPGRSVAFLFTGAKDKAICVYFDGKSPFGVVAVHAGADGSIKPDDISAAFKPVSKDMLKKSDQELQFNKADVNTDDGVSLPAYQITKPGPLGGIR